MQYAYWDKDKYVHMDEDGAILNEIPTVTELCHLYSRTGKIRLMIFMLRVRMI